MNVKVDQNGKVLIPKKIREKLNIQIGDELKWSIMSEKLNRKPSWLLGIWKVEENDE